MDVALVQRRLGVRADGDFGPVTLAALLRKLGAPAGTAGPLAEGIGALEGAVILDSGLRLAHFVAQGGHETLGFTRMVEIWGPTAAQGRYEGRADLGNIRAGDGYRYRGRGVLQVTGRDNYRRFGQLIGVDIESQPDRAAEPAIAMAVACAYWTSRRINAAADRDDVEAVTRLINGGLNGIDDRRQRLARAKAILL
ncbi:MULTISPECIES: glycoside hydrolase family 19 protein [Sphingomonas]|uniref:glycoside hydrolase family 19 protein n=1 Tax=Sphingomonas TaxID=13687 RepID=UPI00254C7EFC|nr:MULTISPECIES: glycoside hydrolase family 19 protein [Sphingomonas]MDK8186736.1 glycoside hydrolase family 19 protein [Sphingomonas zeae]MDK8216400.1 glycoside hydrolase family 19 protein [Sphingomonas sp. UMB7805-LC452B]